MHPTLVLFILERKKKKQKFLGPFIFLIKKLFLGLIVGTNHIAHQSRET